MRHLLDWAGSIREMLGSDEHPGYCTGMAYSRAKVGSTKPLPRARSTSPAVAACSGCTKIPLSAGRAQDDENHSRKRYFRPRFAAVRLPGSARTDQVLGDDGIRLVYSLGNLHRNAFDNDTGGHVFPERDQ